MKKFRFPKNFIRKRLMLEMRGYGKTLQQIGDRFNLTRERIRQIIGSVPKPEKVKRCKNCWKQIKSGQYCDRKCIWAWFYKTRTVKPFSRGLLVELICTNCGIKFERSRYSLAIDVHQNGGKHRKRYCGRCCETVPWKVKVYNVQS